ncbi:lytic transglycosylase domain-containing protein [Thermomonas haemolytica]|uniref:Soluble lytic murein transglycosylase-like protein n=2 Tax=Thermomonas haemolytica TaxID=141949 RepID=A0A4R3N7H0_9GAMM|nr:lytic transglycosylase domain-containing protein [Thermomonas haemolytica]TCT24381.1 soluble lytic murein transglycosylase-like protein [Thermomonas haemolytica]
MRGRAAILLLLLAPGAPALAGNVYRCVGGDGAVSYVNKRPPGAQCRLLGSYRPAPPVRAPTRAPAPAPAPPLAEVARPPAAVASSAPAASPAAAPSPAPAPGPAMGPRLVHGQLYSYVGKDGVRTYTSARPVGVPMAAIRTIQYSYIERCYACGVLPGVDFRTVRLNTTAYSDEIAAAARELGVEEAVVRAIIHAESAFNPNAISRVGAQGLMQLMPATARRFGVLDAFDAGQNIRGGVQYLAWLLKRFNGNLALAAAGYNAGEGAVDKYGGVPPYSETQRYVQRVGVLAERYRGALAGAGAPLRGGLSAR